MKKAAQALGFLFLLITFVAGQAFAATEEQMDAAAARFLALDLILGDENGGFIVPLNASITRAELHTLFVRAHGQENNAALLKGVAAFPDTASHWASGHIAMAKVLVEKIGGDTIGLPDGTFRPDSTETYASVVNTLLKYFGLKPRADEAYPESVVNKAIETGLLDPGEETTVLSLANTVVSRGVAFYYMDYAFSRIYYTGAKTFYQTYLVTSVPALTLNPVSTPTTATTLSFSGTVSTGDAETLVVLVDGGPAEPISVTAGEWVWNSPILAVGSHVFTFTATNIVDTKSTLSQTVEIEPASDPAPEPDPEEPPADPGTQPDGEEPSEDNDKDREIPGNDLGSDDPAFDGATKKAAAAQNDAAGGCNQAGAGPAAVWMLLPVMLMRGRGLATRPIPLPQRAARRAARPRRATTFTNPESAP